jgi:hypothetical protein
VEQAGEPDDLAHSGTDVASAWLVGGDRQ